MDETGSDLVVASTRENIRYFTGFAPVVKTLNPYLGECFAILQRQNLGSVNVVHSAGEADQILDMTAPLEAAWIYGKFYRYSSSGVEALEDELRLQAFGTPKFETAADALIAAIGSMITRDRSCNILVDFEGMTDKTRILLEQKFPNVIFAEGQTALRQVRRVKTHDEISLLTYAALQNEGAVTNCLQKASEGMSEVDVVSNFETAIVALGGRPGVTMTKIGRHAVTGQRSPNPSHQLSSGDILWFDSDTSYKNYWSDIARSAVFGTPNDRQKRPMTPYIKACFKVFLKCVQGGGVVTFFTQLWTEFKSLDYRNTRDIMLAMESD